MDCQNLEFKILEGQNPEFKILDCQNSEFKILEVPNPEFKILAVQNPEFKILEGQNPEVKMDAASDLVNDQGNITQSSSVSISSSCSIYLCKTYKRPLILKLQFLNDLVDLCLCGFHHRCLERFIVHSDLELHFSLLYCV